MDGYEQMIKTKTWAALKKAQEAVFNVQVALKEDGFADVGEEYDARIELGKIENRLRFWFKHKSVQDAHEEGTK